MADALSVWSRAIAGLEAARVVKEGVEAVGEVELKLSEAVVDALDERGLPSESGRSGSGPLLP